MGWWSISVFWFLGSQLEKLYAIEVLYSFILCFLEIFPKLLEDHLQVGKPWTKLPQNVKWDWAKDGRTLARELRTYPTLRWQNSDTSTFCSWTSHDLAGELKNKCGWEDEQSGWWQNAATAVQSRSRVRLCDPRDCSTPGLPVHHQLPELTQSHVHWVGDAIQPSHPLSPSPALNLSQHQGLFKWVSSLHQVAKVLQFQLQHQSFPWIFRTDLL